MSLPDDLGTVVGTIVSDGPDGVTTRDQLDAWLATRHLGLVPVADAVSFSWAGQWIGVTSTGRAVRMFGQPSEPLDAELAPDEVIVSGFVIAPRDLELDITRERLSGAVAGIYIAAETAGPTTALASVRAIAGVGLEGDRYATGGGTFAAPDVPGHHLTLVDADTLASTGIAPGDARRNVVTRGVDLDAAIGREFRIGEVVCRGYRRAEPCAHLQRLAGPGTLRALVHRGGLRADILTGGIVTVGDPVVVDV